MPKYMLALFAASCFALLGAVAACVLSAVFARRASKAASSLRSMTSMHAELLEIRDYLGKLDRWAKRINAREVMNERRDAEPTSVGRSRLSSTPASSKDELRRIAGITAGRPAPHRE
jgi:hypothetical protein